MEVLPAEFPPSPPWPPPLHGYVGEPPMKRPSPRPWPAGEPRESAIMPPPACTLALESVSVTEEVVLLTSKKAFELTSRAPRLTEPVTTPVAPLRNVTPP